MLEVLSRVCLFVRERAATARCIGAAILTGAAFAACAVPPDPEPAIVGQATLLQEVPCVAGTWITPPEACACRRSGHQGFTAECAAADCREADLLLLLPWGDAARATIRYSAREQHLSAAGDGPLEGTWTYYDDGELRLEIADNAMYIPTECEPRELQMKGQPTMIHAPPALDLAIFWAWLTGEWTIVPYLP
jgi:hypothetical protein